MITEEAKCDEVPLGDIAEQSMERIVSERYATHPFSQGVTKENAESLLADYLAMSKAFPYIAAGAQRNLIVDIMEKNDDVPEAMEITSVVSNFLSWDETGGHALVSKHGNPGLPKILNTKNNFHGNHLQQDIDRIFGKTIKPNFSKGTKMYLMNLLEGLSNFDPVIRAATLSAFEMHAEHMISSLWESLAGLYGGSKEDLLYFRIHVGGDDPAEPYHVAMTKNMLEGVLSQESSLDRFLQLFEQAYADNYNWCQSIKELT